MGLPDGGCLEIWAPGSEAPERFWAPVLVPVLVPQPGLCHCGCREATRPANLIKRSLGEKKSPSASGLMAAQRDEGREGPCCCWSLLDGAAPAG